MWRRVAQNAGLNPSPRRSKLTAFAKNDGPLPLGEGSHYGLIVMIGPAVGPPAMPGGGPS
jgi:hypothetical protein